MGRNPPSIPDVAADAYDHDDGAHGQVARIEHADLVLLHQRDALHADRAEEVDRQPAADRQRDSLHQARQFADKPSRIAITPAAIRAGPE
jgi:hypothetical protein